MDYLINSNVYLRGRDLDGVPILMFVGKAHTRGTKNMDDLKRCLVYWIERGLRQSNDGRQITAVFDMSGTVSSNVDIEYTKLIINTFKHYYPNSLNWILTYEMAWWMNGKLKSFKKAFDKSFSNFRPFFQQHFKSSKSFCPRKRLNV
jgi:hypothetical protein